MWVAYGVEGWLLGFFEYLFFSKGLNAIGSDSLHRGTLPGLVDLPGSDVVLVACLSLNVKNAVADHVLPDAVSNLARQAEEW
jgi:hypothetical protein